MLQTLTAALMAMAMASAYSSPLPQTPLPYSSFRRFEFLLPFPKFSSSQKACCFLRFHGKNRYLTATRPALFPVERPYLSRCPSDPLRIRFPSVFASLSGGEGGGDGGSSSGETAGKPVVGDSEDATALGSDVIVLRVGVIHLLLFASTGSSQLCEAKRGTFRVCP